MKIKSNMKNEIKYYTTAEYTEDDSKSFFESVGDFIAGIFGSKEIVRNAEFPVVGKSFNNITSFMEIGRHRRRSINIS